MNYYTILNLLIDDAVARDGDINQHGYAQCRGRSLCLLKEELAHQSEITYRLAMLDSRYDTTDLEEQIRWIVTCVSVALGVKDCESVREPTQLDLAAASKVSEILGKERLELEDER